MQTFQMHKILTGFDDSGSASNICEMKISTNVKQSSIYNDSLTISCKWTKWQRTGIYRQKLCERILLNGV